MIDLKIGKTSIDSVIIWNVPEIDSFPSSLYYFANSLNELFEGIGSENLLLSAKTCFLEMVVGYTIFFFERYYLLLLKPMLGNTIYMPISFEDSYLVVLVIKHVDNDFLQLTIRIFDTTAPSPSYSSLFEDYSSFNPIYVSNTSMVIKSTFLSDFERFISKKHAYLKEANINCTSNLDNGYQC